MSQRLGNVALLLAAGRSSRMGEPKLFLPWGDRPVLRATAEEILGAGFARVIAIAGENHASVARSLSDLAVTVVVNESTALGMHSSIRAGLRAAGEVESFTVCLGDQPMIPASLYRSLLARSRGALLTAPVYGGRRGNPVVIAGRLAAEVLAREDDDRGCAYLFRRHEAQLVEVDDPSVVQDLDTPEDYARALALR